MRRTLACLLLIGWPLQAGAEDRPGEDMAALRAAVAEGRALSLAAVIPNIMAALPGTILDVQFHEQTLGPIYVVTIMSPDWRVWTVIVDAASGVVRNPPARNIPKTRDQT